MKKKTLCGFILPFSFTLLRNHNSPFNHDLHRTFLKFFTELKPFSHLNCALPHSFAGVDSQAFYGSFQQPSVKHPQQGPPRCPRYLQPVPMVPYHVSAQGAVLNVVVVIIDVD